MLSKNEFVSEMAEKRIDDFKGRSRTNVVPRVAKRINIEEKKRVKEKQSIVAANNNSLTSRTEPEKQKKMKRKSVGNSIQSQKVISYSEIKQWNENYRLDGKSVYQLDAEFTSLVKI